MASQESYFTQNLNNLVFWIEYFEIYKTFLETIRGIVSDEKSSKQ